MLGKMFFLAMMLKVFQKTGKPFVCATLYAALLFTGQLMFDVSFGGTWASVARQLTVGWGGSYLYFYLLQQTEDTALYWLVLILGIFPLVWGFEA